MANYWWVLPDGSTAPNGNLSVRQAGIYTLKNGTCSATITILQDSPINEHWEKAIESKFANGIPVVSIPLSFDGKFNQSGLDMASSPKAIKERLIRVKQLRYIGSDGIKHQERMYILPTNNYLANNNHEIKSGNFTGFVLIFDEKSRSFLKGWNYQNGIATHNVPQMMYSETPILGDNVCYFPVYSYINDPYCNGLLSGNPIYEGGALGVGGGDSEESWIRTKGEADIERKKTNIDQKCLMFEGNFYFYCNNAVPAPISPDKFNDPKFDWGVKDYPITTGNGVGYLGVYNGSQAPPMPPQILSDDVNYTAQERNVSYLKNGITNILNDVANLNPPAFSEAQKGLLMNLLKRGLEEKMPSLVGKINAQRYPTRFDSETYAEIAKKVIEAIDVFPQDDPELTYQQLLDLNAEFSTTYTALKMLLDAGMGIDLTTDILDQAKLLNLPLGTVGEAFTDGLYMDASLLGKVWELWKNQYALPPINNSLVLRGVTMAYSPERGALTLQKDGKQVKIDSQPRGDVFDENGRVPTESIDAGKNIVIKYKKNGVDNHAPLSKYYDDIKTSNDPTKLKPLINAITFYAGVAQQFMGETFADLKFGVGKTIPNTKESNETIAYYNPNDKTIRIAINMPDNVVSEANNNKWSLVSSLIHEIEHHKNATSTPPILDDTDNEINHARVVMKQMKNQTFKNTPKGYQENAKRYLLFNTKKQLNSSNPSPEYSNSKIMEIVEKEFNPFLMAYFGVKILFRNNFSNIEPYYESIK